MRVALQAKLAEFKAAGHDVDLEFLEESLIAVQGKAPDVLLTQGMTQDLLISKAVCVCVCTCVCVCVCL